MKKSWRQDENGDSVEPPDVPTRGVLLLFPQNFKKFLANCLIVVLLTNGNQTLL